MSQASAARHPSLLLRYGLAVGTVAVALMIAWLLSPWVQEPSFALFYLAVIITTWYGGLWPGLLATALSFLLANGLFFPLFGQSLLTLDGILRLSVEIAVALAISSLTAGRRQMATQLRQSEERYRAFIAQSSEGIWRFELEQPLATDRPVAEQIDHFYQRAYLAECNDAMAQMYGFNTAGELVGARLGDLLVRDDPQNIAYLQGFIESGYRLVDAESHEVDRTGAHRIFLNTLVGAIEAGQIVRAWGVQRDITERRQAAEALEAAYGAEQAARREAEHALRARELFLSVAAHELKTPLTSLMGQAQLFLRRAEREGQLAERDLRSLQTINAQVRRLNKIVLSLLDISRIESGQLSIERESVDLCALVRRVVEETEAGAEGRLLQLTCRTEPLMVEGDALRLEQVFHNLLQNALKYSPASEPIEIEARAQGAQISVAIRDRGIGIPESALRRLFRRFYRAPNAEEEHFSGLGIGLYIVKEIVGLHGGEVLVESIEGQGSTFTVCLPRADIA